MSVRQASGAQQGFAVTGAEARGLSGRQATLGEDAASSLWSAELRAQDDLVQASGRHGPRGAPIPTRPRSAERSSLPFSPRSGRFY